MPIDPSLITETLSRWQSPQFTMPDPLAQFAKIQALKNGIVQQQSDALDLQQKQQQIVQQQRDMNDQQVLQQVAQDPATMKAITSWDGQSPFPLAGRGLQFKTMQDIQTKVLADQKAALDWTDKQRASNESKLARVGSVLPGLMYDENGKPRDDASIAANAPGLISQLQGEGVLSGPVPAITSFADAQRYALQHGYMEGISKYAQSAREAAAKPALAAAQTAEAQGKGDEAAQAARKTKMVADAMAAAQANPQQGEALIDAAVPPTVDKQANQAYKAAYNAAMSVGNLDGAAQIVATAAGHAASLSPATTAQKVREAVQVESATAPIKIANEVAKQKALAASSPEMFAGIADPVSRRAAQTDYQKLTQDYYEKAQTGQQLQDFITAAKSGNKAAPGLIPLSELRTVVNRVNRQELEAVSDNAGSVYDKVQGWFKGKTEGQPIPSDILSGMEQIANIETRNARSGYENKVNALASTYGGGVRPAAPPNTVSAATAPAGAASAAVPANVKAALANTSPGIHKLSDGSKWMKAADGTVTPQ